MEGTVQMPTATAQMVAEDGTSWLLQYFLQTYQSSDMTQMYGVRVEKLSSEGKLLESKETFAITDDRDKALKVIDFLASGDVPPCVLMEMVHDWLSGEVETAVVA